MTLKDKLKDAARQAQAAADQAAKKVEGATGRYAPVVSVATIIVVAVVALLLLGPVLQALGQFVSSLAALLLRVIGLGALAVLGYLGYKVARDAFRSESKES
jgi:phosphotransferase system  glucose/maltose/N-acetylglucosamine-specific IIC component